MQRTYEQLLQIREEKGAGFFVLIDPDSYHEDEAPGLIETCVAAGVDALLIGGSLLHSSEADGCTRLIKDLSPLPVIGFPGSLSQISPALDAVLFMSVVTSRNPEYLFGQHVYAAPAIRRMGVEPISTAYMLVESGRTTTATYMTSSLPLPRHKPEVAAATALAAEMLGMKLLFADGGSGAEEPVPTELIARIVAECAAPLVVGGGLRSPRAVAERVEAGASFVVVGNAIEERADSAYLAEMAAAAHSRGNAESVSKPLRDGL